MASRATPIVMQPQPAPQPAPAMLLWPGKFQPRRAMRGTMLFSSSTGQYPTIALGNNSNQGHLLVVRHVSLHLSGTSVTIGTAYAQGLGGTVAGGVGRVLGGDGVLPGQLSHSAPTVQQANDFLFSPWGASPTITFRGVLAVLQPGSSFSWQDTTTADGFQLSVIWEAVAVADPDYAALATA